MTRYIFVTILVVLGLLFQPTKVESFSDDTYPLENALINTGAIFKEVKVVSWVKYKDEKVARKSYDEINEFLKKQQENFLLSNYKIAIVPQNRYLVMETMSNKFNFDIVHQKNSLSFLEENGKAYSSTIYTSYFNKRMNKMEIRKLIIDIFKSLKATDYMLYDGDLFYDGRGYSSLVKDYLKVDNKKININIAIRYNNLENRTYIFIGTPVISIEY